MEHYLTLREVASRLEISHQAAHRLCQRGTLAARWIGNMMFVRRADVDRLAASQSYLRRRRKAAPTWLQPLLDGGDYYV